VVIPRGARTAKGFYRIPEVWSKKSLERRATLVAKARH